MTDIQAPAGRYRAALAELPLSASRVDRTEGAVVVISGEVGWVDAALAAAAGGAAAVIVARPEFAAADEIRRLQDAIAVPVVVERPLLRPDWAVDAASGRATTEGWAAPRIVTAEATAPAGSVPVVARDAVGWMRVLGGGPLSVIASDPGLALLETAAGVCATLSVVATDRPGAGQLRAHALGEVRTEVAVEDDRARIVTVTEQGALVVPPRFESSARLALRRMIAALASGDAVEDLSDLAADTAAVEGIWTTAP